MEKAICLGPTPLGIGGIRIIVSGWGKVKLIFPEFLLFLFCQQGFMSISSWPSGHPPLTPAGRLWLGLGRPKLLVAMPRHDLACTDAQRHDHPAWLRSFSTKHCRPLYPPRGFKSQKKALAQPHPAGFLRGDGRFCESRKVT
jgi:hypothetical protein